MPKSEVYNIDCMEYMKTLPDKYFDLVLADPPYGITADHYGGGENLNRKDRGTSNPSTVRKTEEERKEYYKSKNHLFSETESQAGMMKTRALNRVEWDREAYYKKKTSLHDAGKLKNRKLITLDTSWDAFPPTKEYFDELFRVSKNQIIWGGNYFDLPPTRCIVIWDKQQPWENFSQIEMAWTSFDMPAKLFRRANYDKGKCHPTQKSVAVYTYLLEHFAHEGDTILDTHLGSGSSRIACYMKGYDFVGCEIDEYYYLKQEERWEQFLKTQGRVTEVLKSIEPNKDQLMLDLDGEDM